MASEETKKRAVIAGFGAVMVGLVGYYLYGFMAPPPPRVQVAPVIIDRSAPGSSSTSTPNAVGPVAYPAVGGKTATAVSSTGQLDPTLHMEGMLAAEALVYTGTGRNIFSSTAQQDLANEVALNQAAKFPARPPSAPPPPYVAPGPPPPLPVNLKFFGTATQNGVRKALLLGGDDVFLASKGDIVLRRYKIINIAANSILVEDMPNTNQQTLPLLVNP